MIPQHRFRLLMAIGLIVGVGIVGVTLDRCGKFPGRLYRGALQNDATPGDPVDILKESPSGGPGPEDVAARINDYTARISEAAAAMNPNERKALLAAQRVFAPMVPKMAAYERAVKTLNDAGITSPATLSSQEVLRERIGMIRRLKLANNALLEFYRNVEKNYRLELDKEKLPPTVKTA
ncbi:MAG: hypothetical protein V4710_18005 [Verrucomicrobiota bacterium]